MLDAAYNALKERMRVMSKLNPTQTIIVPPANVPWRVPDIAPPDSVAAATLAGGEDQAARTWCS
jgi:hypothetical protein